MSNELPRTIVPERKDTVTKKKKKSARLTPRTAFTLDQICSIHRDNVSTFDHWLMIDGDRVVLCAQRNGQAATANIEMSRATFNAFIDWYNTGVWRKPRGK